MADQRNPLHDITDLADELTDPRRNTERLTHWVNRNRRQRAIWTTTLPSLLDQLAFAVEPGQTLSDTDDSASTATSYESRPAARLEAVSELQRIAREATAWCRQTGTTVRPSLTGTVRALVGAAALMNSTDQAALARDLQRWRNRAATITGWDRPPYAPPTTCMACGARNTIRVRLDQKTGSCLNPECDATWDAHNIGLLAEHIRLDGQRSTRDSKTLRAAAVARRRAEDAARAGHDRPPDLPYACPGCGDRPCRRTARCPRAA